MQDHTIEQIDKRLAELEQAAESLQREVVALRAAWERERSATDIHTENAELREAVLRYAVACGAVDVQVAMLRARSDAREEGKESLQRCLEEQTDASNALRALARRLSAGPEA